MRNNVANVRVGGLLRCCVQTAIELDESEGEFKEGTIITCPYCKAKMIKTAGAFQWLKEDSYD